MILDATHKNWVLACTALALLAAGLYLLQAWLLHPARPSGGSIGGLWFGIAGSALLAFAGLLPLRKWYPLARLGSATSWLRAHIWLSLLGSLLILFHSGFRWRGTLELGLMLLLAALVASGAFGLVAQRVITRQLTKQVSLKTFYENLPQECRMLQFEGDVLVARLCEAPLPLTPEETIATDERLKNRGVLGRDFEARRAKVYAPSDTAKAAAVTVPPLDSTEAPPAAAVAAPKPNDAISPPTAKPLSAAEKIALMRGKRASGEQPASPAIASEPIATAALPQPEDAAGAKALSTAEKLKLMRAKKAPVDATVSAPAPAPPRPMPVRTIQPAALEPFRHDVRSFFLDRVRPFLAWQRSSAGGGLQAEASAIIVFSRVRSALPVELHETMDELQMLCAKRRQLHYQARLHHWLHGWLVFVHIPAAAAMLALALAHIAASLYW